MIYLLISYQTIRLWREINSNWKTKLRCIGKIAAFIHRKKTVRQILFKQNEWSENRRQSQEIMAINRYGMGDKIKKM